MSRVGQAIINIPNGVEVKKVDSKFLVKGSKGELTAPLNEIVDVTINEKEIRVELNDNNAKNKALWGTTRALINNGVRIEPKKITIIPIKTNKIDKEIWSSVWKYLSIRFLKYEAINFWTILFSSNQK